MKYQVSSGLAKSNVEMEVDTGASVSLISEEKFHQLQGTALLPFNHHKSSSLCTLVNPSVFLALQKSRLSIIDRLLPYC